MALDLKNMESVARSVAGRLRAAGWVAYWAGGCVRDRLLGKEPKDFDIATDATPVDVKRIFPRAQLVGAHFGVCVVVEQGVPIEVATFRHDGCYHDGRRPESVSFTNAENDAQRRDFTINGMFYDPVTDELIDYVGGLQDLENGVLRAIGDAERRFEEDKLRLMRAVRFAVTLDFEIEGETWSALRRSAAGLSVVSIERIQTEWSRILESSRRRRGVTMLDESGLLDVFFPEFQTLKGCDQPPQFHPEGDVYIHVLIMLDMLRADADVETVLSVLLHDIAKPPTQTVDGDGRIRFNGHAEVGAIMAEAILRRWKYPNRVVDNVVEMVRHHMTFKDATKMRVAKLKRFMARPTFEQELELHRVDCLSSNGLSDNLEFLLAKKSEYDSEPLLAEPLVTGADLIALGWKPGPQFREVLESARDFQLEGRFAAREEALIWLRELDMDSAQNRL